MANKKPTTAWQGALSFGLITFPVRAFTGAREEKISFNQICPEHKCRIKMPITCPGNGVPHAIENRATLLKGYEHSKDEFVYVTKEEIERSAPETSKSMEIIQFVKASEVPAIYLDASYLLCPGEGAGDPFRLVRAAMERGGWMGLAKLTMHGSEQLVGLQPYRDGAMLMHTLFYANEVRQVEFDQPEGEANPAMLAICGQLIETLAGSFDPTQFKDERSEKVRALLAARVAGQDVPTAAEPPKKAPVMDMMAALAASLAAAQARGGNGHVTAAAA
jgi:DNA end-binding protein Ku